MMDLMKRGGTVYYLYTHARPDGSIFYVGKGVGDRARDFWNRGEYHKRVVAKHGEANIQVAAYACFDERHAYAIERQLIALMRKAGIPLINVDHGGVGRLGVKHSEEHKQKLRQALLGHTVSEETRLKISAKGVGRVATAQTRAKLSALSRTAQVQAMAAANRGKPKSEQTKAKIAAANKGKVRTPEMLERLSQAHKGFKQDPEVVARRALAIRATYAARRMEGQA